MFSSPLLCAHTLKLIGAPLCTPHSFKEPHWLHTPALPRTPPQPRYPPELDADSSPVRRSPLTPSTSASSCATSPRAASSTFCAVPSTNSAQTAAPTWRQHSPTSPCCPSSPPCWQSSPYWAYSVTVRKAPPSSSPSSRTTRPPRCTPLWKTPSSRLPATMAQDWCC